MSRPGAAAAPPPSSSSSSRGSVRAPRPQQGGERRAPPAAASAAPAPRAAVLSCFRLRPPLAAAASPPGGTGTGPGTRLGTGKGAADPPEPAEPSPDAGGMPPCGVPGGLGGRRLALLRAGRQPQPALFHPLELAPLGEPVGRPRVIIPAISRAIPIGGREHARSKRAGGAFVPPGVTPGGCHRCHPAVLTVPAAPLPAAPAAPSPALRAGEKWEGEPEIQVSHAAYHLASPLGVLGNAAEPGDASLSPWSGKAAYPLRHPVLMQVFSLHALSGSAAVVRQEG